MAHASAFEQAACWHTHGGLSRPVARPAGVISCVSRREREHTRRPDIIPSAGRRERALRGCNFPVGRSTVSSRADRARALVKRHYLAKVRPSHGCHGTRVNSKFASSLASARPRGDELCHPVIGSLLAVTGRDGRGSRRPRSRDTEPPGANHGTPITWLSRHAREFQICLVTRLRPTSWRRVMPHRNRLSLGSHRP